MTDFAAALPRFGALAGLDLGTKTIGVAVSDGMRGVASPITTIRRTKFTQDAQALLTLIADRGLAGLVLGLPRNMDGSEGARAKKCRRLADTLRAVVTVPVELWDERRTTISAANILSENGTYGKKRKAVLDAVAATVILENYLSYRRAAGKT